MGTPKNPQSVWLPTRDSRRAHFSTTTTTITTCSPSLQAGSGSVCVLQPSERAPPLQREDKEKKDNKQKEGGEEGERKESDIKSFQCLRKLHTSCKINK